MLLPALLLPAPTRAESAGVKVSTEVSGGGTRVVLTHTRQLVFAVREGDGRLEVVYGEPVVVEPPAQQVGTDALSRYAFQGGDTLTFYTGESYRGYQSFELRNPFRLVLDLQGADMPNTLPAPRKDAGGTIVVLDPGHGGIENGATGPGGLLEKDITLDLARRLQQQLDQLPGVSVVLTRDEDRLVGLDERTAIANHNRADLFVSIHLNSSPRVDAKGAETYFLSSDATDDQARTTAALENRDHVAGTNDALRGGGSASLDLVLWDLAQNQYLAESSGLAESVQRYLNELTGTRDRGVRQAPVRVLMGATMPAILVEVGFISNRDEEARFRSMGYRSQVVDALGGAIREYLDQVRRKTGRLAPSGP